MKIPARIALLLIATSIASCGGKSTHPTLKGHDSSQTAKDSARKDTLEHQDTAKPVK